MIAFARSAGNICRDEGVIFDDAGEFSVAEESWVAGECENRPGVGDRVPMVQSCAAKLRLASKKDRQISYDPLATVREIDVKPTKAAAGCVITFTGMA